MHEDKVNSYLIQVSEQISKLRVDQNIDIVIDMMIECYKNNSKVITTGMGKAGIAMRKFSATLSSLGIPSVFLHAGEAMHGDLGIISENDIIFVASTSGKTREVLDTMDLGKKLHKNIKIIGITSHKDSELRNKADVIIDMGEFKELGKLGLAPTTSIIIMVAITDSIAILLSEITRLTSEDYFLRHHSGYLGEKAKELSSHSSKNVIEIEATHNID